jgi:tetratricopeptide (TPR) repeat protein
VLWADKLKAFKKSKPPVQEVGPLLKLLLRKCHQSALPACLGLLVIAAHAIEPSSTPVRQQTPLSASQQTYRAGMTLVQQDRLDEAIAIFQKGLAGDSGNAVLLDAIGAAYTLQGNFEQANKYFLDCLTVAPQFIPARKNLAINYFNLGQYDLAATELAKLKGTPGAPIPTVNLFLGMIAEKNGDYVRALSLSEQAGHILYTYPEALLSFSDAAIHVKQPHRAESALRAFENIPGITASQYMKAGELYAILGENVKALGSFDKARALDQNLPGLAYGRAALLDQMNRSQEALTILKDLATTKPDSHALNLLAHVAEKNREFALAMDSLRQAAKLDPSREENYLDFGTICADYGNYSLALQAADVGLDHIPNSYRLLVQKGVVLENLGRPDEAENILKSASQLQQDNSVARLSLAIVQTHAGQLQEAERTLTAALRDFPDNYYMHYQLGKVLVQIQEAGKDDPAIAARTQQAFKQAIRLNPSFADSYYQLAKLTLRETPVVAERNLVICLRLDPEHAPAEYMLARLYLSTRRRAAGQTLIDRFEKLQQAAKLKEQQEPRINAAQN